MSTRTREGLDSPTSTKEEKSRSTSLQHPAEVCLNRMNKNKFMKIIKWKSNLLPPRNYKGSFQQNSCSTFINQRKRETQDKKGTGRGTNKQKIHI